MSYSYRLLFVPVWMRTSSETIQARCRLYPCLIARVDICIELLVYRASTGALPLLITTKNENT